MLKRLYTLFSSQRIITEQHHNLLRIVLKIGFISFLLYALLVYFLFSKFELGLLNGAAFIIFLLTCIDYRINSNFLRASTISSITFILFFLALIYLTENQDLTLFGTFLVPVFLFFINGRRRGSIYTTLFLLPVYLMAYQGISTWNDGTFSTLSFSHYLAATMILVAFVYFIKRSFENNIINYHKQNTQLKEAQAIANIGSWEWDINSGELQWSEQTYKMFGLIQGKDEASYEKFIAAVHPEDRQTVIDAVNDSITNRTCYNVVHRIQTPNSEEQVVRECGEVFYDDENRACRMLGTVQDITSQRTIQKKLNEQKEAFETIFKKSNDGVLIIKDNRFIDCNDAAMYMLGASTKDQVLQASPGEISPPLQPNGNDSLQYAQQMIEKALNDGICTFECYHKRFDGNIFMVDVVLTRLEINHETVIHASWRDITEKKALEAELKIHQENLEAAVEEKTKELYVQKENAEKANKAKSEFLANMNHELRTPMNAILGFLHLLSSEEKDPKRKQYFDLVEEGSQSLLNIINDVLDFSKIESGKFTLHLKDADVAQTAKKFIEFLSGAAQKKCINYHVNIDETIPMMNIDILRLEQIISNFIGNAIKFTPELGDIYIKLFFDKEKEQLVFSVKDTGIGISKENQEKIFQPFSQVDMSSTRAYTGTGLGLSISLQLIKMFDGKLTLQSELGKGSTFGFTIPYRKAINSGSTHQLFEASEIELTMNKSILLAEDNEMNLFLFEELFKKLNIKNVTFVRDGQEALDAYKKHSFDLLLLDIDMPIMNGKEAYSTIREYEKEHDFKQSKIVAVTANSDEESKKSLQTLGFDGFLAKPINFSDFKRVIQTYL